MGTEPLITLDRVAVRVGGRRVLQDISWQIRQGEYWVIRGSNGAGKSTLARTLLGSTAVVAGRLQRHYLPSADQGEPVALVSSEQYHRLYAQEQFLAQMRSFSGRVHDVKLAGPAIGITDGNDKAAPDWVHWPETAELAAKPLEGLSSGEMRKLLIVRALAERPRLLILDEPFNGLDAPAREQLSCLLRHLHDTGLQMVIITHRDTDVPYFCTHALELDQGRVMHQMALSAESHYGRCGSERPVHQNIPLPISDPPAQNRPPNESDELIRMEDVTVRYGDTLVLDQVTWRVRSGENWALTGPNGAGKTTLLKLITGDNLQGYANRLHLFGRPRAGGESIWQIRGRIGYVADDLQARYQRRLTGLEVVCSGFFDSIGLYALTTTEQRRMARHWMDRLDIAELADRTMARLSFGEQRLLLIARAMIKEPRLLILDEPCNGLDTSHRQRLLAIMDRIGSKGVTSLLYVTHRPDEMPACITHFLCLEAGRVVATHSKPV